MVRMSRRALLGGVGASLGVSSGCLTLFDRSKFGSADWPLLQSDSGQTNYSSTTGPVDGAEVAWSRSFTPPSPEKPLLLSDGTLYTLVADGDSKYLSESLSLHGIDAETGETTFRMPNVRELFTLGATSSYDNGMVLGRGQGPYDDNVTLGINPDGGSSPRRWAHSKPAVQDFRNRSLADSQTVLDGTWFYTASISSQDGNQTRSNEIVAVGVDDGRTRWRREFETEDDWSLVATDGHLVLTIDHDYPDEKPSTIRTLDPDDGHTRREITGGKWDRSMARTGTVYAMSNSKEGASKLAAYEVDTLEQQWERQISPLSADLRASAVGPNLVVVVIGNEIDDVESDVDDIDDVEPIYEIHAVAFDRETGREQWRQRVPFEIYSTAFWHVSLSIGADTVYLVESGFQVAGLSAMDGSVRWKTNIAKETLDGSSFSDGKVSRPVVGDGRLYFLLNDSGAGLVALEEP